MLNKMIWLSGLLCLLAVAMLRLENILFYFLLIVLLFVSLLRASQQNRFHQLQYSVKRGWQLFEKGAHVPVSLQASSMVTPVFAVLRFKTEQGASRSSLIMPDNLSQESFRQLRVLLRVEGIRTDSGDLPGA